MHRSGTSLCANILNALGVDIVNGHANNSTEYWERPEIVAYHDRILSLLNRDYFGPYHDIALPDGWSENSRVLEVERELETFISERLDQNNARPFGFKDPRTAR